MFQQSLLWICFSVSITIFSWLVSLSDFEGLFKLFGYKPIDEAYDFIIVGAGVAGCTVARRLAENENISIALLEAGGQGNSLLSVPVAGPMLQQSSFDWKYSTTKQKNACLGFDKQKCKFPLGKILGGSHRLNNMIYTRGHPSDYLEWFKDFPNYTYENDIERYFKKAEQYYEPEETFLENFAPALITPSSFTSQIASIILRTFEKLGYSTSTPTQSFFGGFYRPMVTQKYGRRWTTCDHLKHMKFPNVEIFTKTEVDKIIFNREQEAVAVRINYNGKKMTVKSKKSIILSAGTIGSAKLMMLSGVGPKNHLDSLGIPVIKDLPVGNNLQDHLTTGFDLVRVDKKVGIDMLDVFNPLSLFQYFFESKGPWTSNGVDVIGFSNNNFLNCKNHFNSTFCYRYSQYQPDIEFMMLPLGITADLGVHLKSLLGVTDDVWKNFYGDIVGNSLSLLPVLLHPKSRGNVRLMNRNPKSKPIIDPNYLTHPDDIKTLLNFIIHWKKFFNTIEGNVNAKLFDKPFPGCERHDFGSFNYWECYIRHMSTTCYHPIGTLKMGNGNDSVVDFEFKVRGVHKLHVVDGSVLPSQISGHIMAPIIMMAERAADSLKKL